MICSLAIDGSAQTPQNNSDAASGSISGRVIIDGKPASGVIVIVRRRTITFEDQLKQFRTDDKGFYLASGLLEGDYHVRPSVLGWVVTNPDTLYQQKNVTVRAGATVNNIDFTMERGGVITGRIVNSDGKPMIETRVCFSRNIQPSTDSSRNTSCIDQVQTDDRGVYRAFGLAAGRYRIGSHNDQYPLTFHPGTTDESKATVIEVRLGGEVSNVDIRYGRSKYSYSASGRVINGETGAPLSNVPVSLVWSENGEHTHEGAPQKTGYTNANGEFRITNILQGHHFVYLLPSANSRDYFSDYFTIHLPNEDLTGIEIKAYPGASISGRVIINGSQDPDVLAQARRFRLRASLVNPSGGIKSNGADFQITDEASFRISGLRPGLVRIQDEAFPKGFTLIRIERNGKAQGDGINIAPREDFKDVTVVVGYGTGVIRGQVELKGEAQIHGNPMLFVSNTERMGPGIPFLVNPMGALDSQGRFLIDGLVPGEYNVSVNFMGVGLYRETASASQIVKVTNDVETQVKLIADSQAEQYTDLRLIYGSGSGVIRGQIEVKGDELPKGARCFLTINRVEKLGSGEKPGGASLLELDTDGRFSIEELPPGDYNLKAMLRSWWMDGRSPYESSESAEQIVTVSDKSEIRVNFVVNLIKKGQRK